MDKGENLNKKPSKQNSFLVFINHIRYQFDKSISRGPLILGAWVALASILLILLISVIAYLARLNPNASLPVIIWDMLLQALAPNPVDVGLGPWPFLLAMLIITLVGIFMVSVFIGIITNSIENKITSLRKGRSRIIEKGHTVILGWDEHIFTIVHELAIAHQNHGRSCLVIMGEKDKVEMEEEIRTRVGDTGRMEIVCRSGSPIDMLDLEIVSINTAKSIIILAPDHEEADTHVIKTLLAIINNPNRRPEPYHIVTEIHDPFNIEAARVVGKKEASILLMSDIIAHITAQTCRQSGLSVVYTELLNFEGDEIYFQEEPALVGKRFGEAIHCYKDSSVIGLRPKGDRPRLNPPMDTVIQPGDCMIAISEDDDTVRLSGPLLPPVQEESIRLGAQGQAAPEHTLILNWNKRTATIVRELDEYVVPGSSVTLVTAHNGLEGKIKQLQDSLKNQALTYQHGNPTDRRLLESLSVERFKHVVVLADPAGRGVQHADARTLMTLLHLRDIDERAGQPFSIVSEMLDIRNRNLAEVTRVDDFIVSDELASLLMAQISENEELSQVFEELFYSEGSEIFLKPATDYVCPGQPVNFYTVVEAARRRGEIAIGYRSSAGASDPQQAFGVVVNPDKTEEHVYQEGDRVIVLAES